MNQKNTKKLYKDFPNLYKQHKLDMTQTCLCWGFDVEDGWYDLIYELSQKLVLVSPTCEASQVKEKFGGLRFYVDNCNEDGHKLISEYETKSYHVCEECGKKGVLREDLPWIRTLCLKHYKEKMNPEYLLKKRKERLKNGKK